MPGSNLLLNDMVGPQLPAAIDWWPQTLGWQLIAGALLGFIGIKLYGFAKSYIANQYRRDALSELGLLSLHDPAKALHEMNRLLKHAACHVYSDAGIAALSGNQWLNFLVDSSYANFNTEIAERWQQALFNPHLLSLISDEELTQLKQQCEIWLKTHQDVAHD